MTALTEQESLLDEAKRALDLVDRNPGAALMAADDVLDRIPRQREPEAVATAERAAALALRELGDLPTAERRLRSAIRRVEGTSTRAAAEARMSLAFVLLEEGRTKAALNAADRAASALVGVEAARLEAQRGLVLQRSGHTDQALAAFKLAMPKLLAAGDLSWQARVLNNRGLLYAYRGELVAAAQDLTRARSIWAQLGQQQMVSTAEWNLGFVAAMRGDVIAALVAYEAAERTFGSTGIAYAGLLLDKCQVLLACGLSDEAAVTAERAVGVLRSSGAGADVGEGLLIAAQANIDRGLFERASAQADDALSLFAAQARPGWALRAKYVRLLATSADNRSASTLKTALDLRQQLAAARWREQVLDVTLLAARLAAELGDVAAATGQLERARTARSRGPLALRVRGWYAEALLRQRNGDSRGARSAIRAGLALIRREQQMLGASDLRAHISALGRDLAKLDLRMAIESGGTARILASAERLRASSLTLTPVRPPDDSELSALMSELRRIMKQEDSNRVEAAGTMSRTTTARRSELEDRVRTLSRLSRGAGGIAADVPPRKLVASLKDQLGSRAFVEMFDHDGAWHAVTVVDKVIRHRPLCDLMSLRIEVESLRFAMTRAAGDQGRETLVSAMQRAAERLDRLTFGRLPELDDRELVLSPSAHLHAAPWSALPSLRGRAVSIVPSARTWLAALEINATAGSRALLVAGPDLPGGEIEVDLLVSGVWPDAKVLRGAEATAAAVLGALPTASLAHVASHGHLRTDNPMFSALRLVDGPLTVYDIEGLPSVPPLVVLPACRSAAGLARAGDETLGLSYALLALGARTVVASVLPITDDDTADVMYSFHAALKSGSPPARALASAVHQANHVSASAFVCLGAG